MINDPVFGEVSDYVRTNNLKGLGWFFAQAAKEKLARDRPAATSLQSGTEVARG